MLLIQKKKKKKKGKKEMKRWKEKCKTLSDVRSMRQGHGQE